MRLFEIVAKPNAFAITPKFASNYTRFIKKYPDLPEEMLAFCDAKLEGRKFGKRDKPFTGDPLAGYSHAHINLKDGLVIVIYNRVGETIRLYELLSHKGYEGSNIPSLRKWLRSIPDSAFTVVNPEKTFVPKSSEEPTQHFSDEERAKVMDELFYLISEEAFDIIAAVLEHNNWDTLIEWIADIVPELDQNQLFAEFGGQSGIKEILRKGLKDYGKLDNYQRFLQNKG
jgi:hypothetical protein